MDFVNEMEFERLGVFAYSAEEDTPAYSYPDQVPQEVKEGRRDEIMELQQDISAELGERRIGQELLVMIEGKVAACLCWKDLYGRAQCGRTDICEC